MALAEIHFYSKLLGKQVGLYACVPDEGTPPFPTFYVLHGLSDDYTIWLRRTSIERYATRYAMNVVMPDGFRGFYTNHPNDGPPYARYVAEEIVGVIERLLPA